MNKNKIILELNKKNDSEKSPFLEAFDKRNIDMVKLLMNYANKIILFWN